MLKHSMVDCTRCKATTLSGVQCSRTTCRTKDYCYQHLQKLDGLRVKPSRIPGAGLGLYTTRGRKKGEVVASYSGTASSKPRGLYSVQVGKGKYLNSASSQDGVGRYANTCRRQNRPACKDNNARFSVSAGGKSVKLRATRPIHAGDEVYVSYGRGYRIM